MGPVGCGARGRAGSAGVRTHQGPHGPGSAGGATPASADSASGKREKAHMTCPGAGPGWVLQGLRCRWAQELLHQGSVQAWGLRSCCSRSEGQLFAAQQHSHVEAWWGPYLGWSLAFLRSPFSPPILSSQTRVGSEEGCSVLPSRVEEMDDSGPGPCYPHP